MEIPVKRLRADAVLPSPHHPGDAGADLVAVEEVTLAPNGGRAMVATGFALAIPDGYAGFVLPRSGLAARHGVTCANAPGLIDAGYRGEVMVALVNLDPEHEYIVRPGDRIAQLVIMAVESMSPREVDDLEASERGTGGFGSSGR